MKKKKYILAVSGGIDSIMLLDLFAKNIKKEDLLVAHFDHGIRDNSYLDALFVKRLADNYKIDFVLGRGRLRRDTSEDEARRKRYDFLYGIKKEYGGVIVTAHHKNDVVESIAINVLRGTGWRGLTVMNNLLVFRPLIYITKEEIKKYVLKNNLSWREDQSNASNMYLRNRIRKDLESLPDEKKTYAVDKLFDLRNQQIKLSEQIELEVLSLIPTIYVDFKKPELGFRRHFFIMADEKVCLELLRFIFKEIIGDSLTIKARKNILIMIKVAKNNTLMTISKKHIIRFNTKSFTIE